MKQYSDEFCVGVYNFNNKRQIAILESPGNLLDVITHRRYAPEDFEVLSYVAPSKGLYKYYIKQFKKHCGETALTDIEMYETGFGSLCSPLMRFFNLDYCELFQEKNSTATMNFVITKCAKWFSRYVDDKTIPFEFAKQASLFSNVIEVFSFVPEEINRVKVPFWYELTRELFSERIIHKLNGGILVEAVSKCNAFNFNLAKELTNLSEFDAKLQEMKKNVIAKISSEYRSEVLKAAQERIEEAKTTLSEELEFAKANNDSDLLSEVESIYGLIKELDRTIEQQVADLPTTIDIIDWWPELLYPAPKLKYELTQEYYNLDYIQTYFIK